MLKCCCRCFNEVGLYPINDPKMQNHIQANIHSYPFSSEWASDYYRYFPSRYSHNCPPFEGIPYMYRDHHSYVPASSTISPFGSTPRTAVYESLQPFFVAGPINAGSQLMRSVPKKIDSENPVRSIPAAIFIPIPTTTALVFSPIHPESKGSQNTPPTNISQGWITSTTSISSTLTTEMSKVEEATMIAVTTVETTDLVHSNLADFNKKYSIYPLHEENVTMSDIATTGIENPQYLLPQNIDTGAISTSVQYSTRHVGDQSKEQILHQGGIKFEKNEHNSTDFGEVTYNETQHIDERANGTVEEKNGSIIAQVEISPGNNFYTGDIGTTANYSFSTTRENTQNFTDASFSHDILEPVIRITGSDSSLSSSRMLNLSDNMNVYGSDDVKAEMQSSIDETKSKNSDVNIHGTSEMQQNNFISVDNNKTAITKIMARHVISSIAVTNNNISTEFDDYTPEEHFSEQTPNDDKNGSWMITGWSWCVALLAKEILLIFTPNGL
ncbi:hypothetical protein DdX_02442 [Ditylenchus destructor]|uniref:Uncharacterized protein n=1 Tax=Ditylenchus destructor TaxID=166010 RepID=A0AAD4RC09_9BILA|nr:hypothetical protein DdX_02442 [Ditylenchus destructor]